MLFQNKATGRHGLSEASLSHSRRILFFSSRTRAQARRLLPHTAVATWVYVWNFVHTLIHDKCILSLQVLPSVSESGHRREGCCNKSSCHLAPAMKSFPFIQVCSHCCRFCLLFQNKGTGRKAVATKHLLSGSSNAITHNPSAIFSLLQVLPSV